MYGSLFDDYCGIPFVLFRLPHCHSGPSPGHFERREETTIVLNKSGRRSESWGAGRETDQIGFKLMNA